MFADDIEGWDYTIKGYSAIRGFVPTLDIKMGDGGGEGVRRVFLDLTLTNIDHI